MWKPEVSGWMMGALSVGLLAATAISPAAADEALKPFVLAERAAGGSVAEVSGNVTDALTDAGFEFLGAYQVHEDAHVLVVTHDELKGLARDNARSAYLAPVRVSVTEVGGDVQVSYNNLEYFRHAYRVESDVSQVGDLLAGAIGKEQYFGSDDGKTPRQLQRYRYMFGMERFDDPYELATWSSSAAAREFVEGQLADTESGVREVYRLDMPAYDVTVYGVAVREEAGAPEDASDLHKLGTVDVGALRHTAYLPYEILVHDGRIEALHMRFRMALHWPDLGMMGANSFMELRRSPGVLEDVLMAVAGEGDVEDEGFQW